MHCPGLSRRRRRFVEAICLILFLVLPAVVEVCNDCKGIVVGQEPCQSELLE